MMVGMLGMNLIRWRRLDDRENWRNEDRMTGGNEIDVLESHYFIHNPVSLAADVLVAEQLLSRDKLCGFTFFDIRNIIHPPHKPMLGTLVDAKFTLT